MALSPTSSRGVTLGGAAGGDLTGTYPNPTLATARVNQVKVTLSSAQLLALNATPVTLVSAVAGTLPWPLYMVFRLHAGGTAYAGAGNLRWFVGASWPAADLGGETMPALSFFANATDKVEICAVVNDQLSTVTTAGVVGQPLRISASAALTLGDGTLDVTVAYVLVV